MVAGAEPPTPSVARLALNYDPGAGTSCVLIEDLFAEWADFAGTLQLTI